MGERIKLILWACAVSLLVNVLMSANDCRKQLNRPRPGVKCDYHCEGE